MMQETRDDQQAAKGNLNCDSFPPDKGGLRGVDKEVFSGLLVIDKPVGITSFDVIRIARKRLQTKKIGHAGTLDPFASGVLLLAVGSGTKALSSLLKANKTYFTTIVFGVDSDTLDCDGKLEFCAQTPTLTETQITEVLQSFSGEISQVPPQYSAIKINGKPAYKHARNGEVIELQSKQVTTEDIELIECGVYEDGDFAGKPYAMIRLGVGSGFYVRSFARDLGAQLGTKAICTTLRRESVGRFALDEAVVPDEINPQHIFPLSAADFPFASVLLDHVQYADFCQGKRITLPNTAAGQMSVFFEGKWCGFGDFEDGSLQPKTVIHL